LFGSEYDMAYFMLCLIPGVWQIISQLICNISTYIICGGSCRCWQHRYSECLCYPPWDAWMCSFLSVALWTWRSFLRLFTWEIPARPM